MGEVSLAAEHEAMQREAWFQRVLEGVDPKRRINEEVYPPEVEKLCSRCGEWWLLSQFPGNRCKYDGKNDWCEACWSDYNRERYQARKK